MHTIPFISKKKLIFFLKKKIKKNSRLCHDPLIVTTSCLSSVNKSKVSHLVTKLGGHLVQDWTNECELVIMDSITVTVKVIDALICQKRIVTVRYLEEIIKSESLPDPRE